MIQRRLSPHDYSGLRQLFDSRGDCSFVIRVCVSPRRRVLPRTIEPGVELLSQRIICSTYVPKPLRWISFPN